MNLISSYTLATVIVIWLALVQKDFVESACTTKLTCAHHGLFNENLCVCECFPAYSGTTCEIGQCNNQPKDCGTGIPTTQCTDPLIVDYCPLMCGAPICKCGFDSCLNGGFFSAASCTCVCPNGFTGKRCEIIGTTTTPPPCPAIQCQNGAKLNPTTCKCDCFPSYTGQLCEILSCANEPLVCKGTLTLADCKNTDITYYCPVLCGRCAAATTTAATTAKACGILNCFNGAKLNPDTCVCECYPAYTGQYCENLNCNKQPAICNDFTTGNCKDISVFYYCPVLCGVCNLVSNSTAIPPQTTSTTIKPATTTTATTLAPGVTTTTSCAVLSCKNGGQFDQQACKCSCLPAYTGALCEILNCNLQPPECSTIAPAQCTGSSITFYCPQICGLCTGVTTIPPTTTTTACQLLACKNGGQFNPQTCKCNCLPAYSGNFCETLNCNLQPPECSGIAATQCPGSTITYYCPVVCGLCPGQTTVAPSTTTVTTAIPTTSTTASTLIPPTTTTVSTLIPTTTTTVSTLTPTTTTTLKPTTTVQACVTKTCNYGFVFDLTTCKCNCGPGFYGDTCTFNCTSGESDDSACSVLTCTDEIVKGICPNKCLCPGNPVCPSCFNNGKINPTNCVCTCPTGFSGNRCQYANNPCDIDDLPECGSVNCWNATESVFFNCQRKCLCCSNKQCGPYGLLQDSATEPTKECECSCFGSNYDPAQNCKLVTCIDPPYCANQFGTEDCSDSFVKAACPKLCRVC